MSVKVPGIDHGIQHVVDGHGAKAIKGDRGQEIDYVKGDNVKLGLDVHPIHRIGGLDGHDGANETLPHSGHDHGFTAGHGHHMGGDHAGKHSPAGHDHGMAKG